MGKKSVNNLYKPMLEHSNVEQKFHKAAKGKTERPDVAVILEPTNIQRHVKNVVEQLENTAPEGYDVPHPEKAWKPSRHGKVCINEGTSRKVRMIEKPRYNYEQVIHHIVVSACYDIFMKFRFLSVEGGAMALIKSVKTVTKKDTGKQHENEPDDINADNNEEVQG